MVETAEPGARWQASNDAVAIAVEPSHGARIVSLRDRSGAEWIAQPAAELTHRSPGDSFVRPEIGGWDEMVNTIEACTSPVDGTTLPDHGDAWASPWTVLEATPTGITTEFTSSLIPLTLQRRVDLTTDGLSIRYAVTNDTATTLPFFWTAHPLFTAADVGAVDLIATEDPILVAVTPDPPDQTELIPRRLNPGTSVKYWCDPSGPAVTGIRMTQPDSTMTMSWSADEIPYFGIFVDHGEYGPGVVVAPEPAIAYYDSAERAALLGHLPTLEPGDERRWTIDVAFQQPSSRRSATSTQQENQ